MGRCTTAISIVLFSTAVSVHADGFDQVRDFNIEEQALDTALIEFSEQAGVQLMVPTELVAGLRSPSIAGKYAPDNALAALLDGSELTFQTIGDDTVTLSKVDERTAPGKHRPTPSPMLMAQVSVEQNRKATAGTAKAVNEDVDEADFRIEEIIVTGTNIRGEQNPTTPLLSFDRQDIELSGAATVEDFLRTIPQNFASETQLTADSVNPNDSGRNQVQGTSIDLRGLGAGSTLTLLNGRRMTATGSSNFVDISVLPLGAIERVDVLLDGASAIYGSDAVGGAVNFITRRDYEGLDVNGQYGTVTDGSQKNWSLGAAGGVNWRSGGMFIGGSYLDQTPLLSSERDFIDQSLINEGATLGRGSERYSLAGSLNQSITSTLTAGIDFLYSEIESEASQNIIFGSLDNRIARSDQSALFLNSRLEYEIKNDIVASLFFDYGKNRVDNTDSDTSFATVENRDNDLIVVEGRVSGSLANVRAGEITFSIGSLYREEEFSQFIDGGNTAFDVQGQRDIIAFYAETLIPIVTSDYDIPLVQRLEVSLAGRYEDYSDFGDTLDPKVGLYWEINSQLSLRGSYSQSFRAPDLQSISQRQIFTVSPFPTLLFTSVEPPAPDDRILLPNFILALTPAGGNPGLGPETAETWSAGFSYEPKFIQGLSLQANYFNILYKDRLERVDNFDTVQIPAFRDLVEIPPQLAEIESIFDDANVGVVDLFLPPSLLVPFDVQPEDIQVLFRSGFQNVSERDISGVDIEVQYERDTNVGRFSTALNMQYQFEFKNRITPFAETVDQLDILYRPVGVNLRGSASWSRNGFTAFAAINYTDSYRDRFDESIASRIDSWTTYDLALSYNIGDQAASPIAANTSMNFSVRNLLDEDPPFVETGFGLNFDSANADPFGRAITFSIAKRF